MKLKKVVLASILAAVSVVIDIIFKSIIPLQTLGTPFYAIPIIVAAIFLDVRYSVIIAFLGDGVAVLLSGQTYLPLFTLSALMWGLIPGLFLKHKSNFGFILLIVFVTHILATTLNSYALYVHFHRSIEGLLVDLPIRLSLIIPNSLVVALLVKAVLVPIEEKLEMNDDGN